MQQERPVLPPELFRPIFSLISHTPSLYALSLSSKAFQDEAQRGLFRNPPIPNNRSAAYNHLRFLESVINSPERLAKLVLCYIQTSIWTTSTAQYRGSPEEQNETIEEITPIALRLMVNLKHLTYRKSGGEPSAHIPHGCSFQLETLNWGCHTDEVSMFQDILPTQPRLLRLEMLEVDTAVLKKDSRLWNSTKELLPELVSLTGSRGTLEAILPGRHGRPVECIEWIPNDFDSREDSVHHMSHELGHVRYMAIGGYFRRPSMSLLVDYLLNVELLDILHCTQEELTLLGKLPKLCHLILSAWMRETSRGEDACLALARLAFNGCRHLRQIDVKHTRQYYLRYKRTGTSVGNQVLKLPVDEVESWRDSAVPVTVFEKFQL